MIVHVKPMQCKIETKKNQNAGLGSPPQACWIRSSAWWALEPFTSSPASFWEACNSENSCTRTLFFVCLFFMHISMYLNQLESLLKARLLVPTRVSDSVSLGWCLRILISNKFSGDADATGSGPTTWKPEHQGTVWVTARFLLVFPQTSPNERNRLLQARLRGATVPNCDNSIALCWHELFIFLFDTLELKASLGQGPFLTPVLKRALLDAQ